MTLSEAKEEIRIRGVPLGDVYEKLDEHNREVLKAWFTGNDDLPNLVAREARQPLPTGNLCDKCGGMTVRTGTCVTCQSCGDSSGGCS